MKKYVCLILILFLCFISPITKTYASVDKSLKIYDYAEVLTDSEEKELKQLIDNYIDNHNLDMVIVTENDYYGSNMEYADDFYDNNDFGIGNTKDGILLFLNYNNGGIDAHISTSGEGIRMYDDARIDSLLDELSYNKTYGNFSMIKAFIEKSNSLANEGIPNSNKDSYIDENGDLHYKKKYPLIFIPISLLISVIVVCILIAKNKMVKKAITASEYLDKSSLVFTNRQDKFLTTHTSRVKIETNSGGRSGGSSTHRSSSGRSHGGGGRRL